MLSTTKLILISALILVAPLSFALAKEPKAASSASQDVCERQARAVSADQKDKIDPNGPCFELLRASLDEKSAEAQVVDINRLRMTEGDPKGRHPQPVMNNDVASDTTTNVYEFSYLKSSLSSSTTAPSQPGADGDQKSGTD